MDAKPCPKSSIRIRRYKLPYLNSACNGTFSAICAKAFLVEAGDVVAKCFSDFRGTARGPGVSDTSQLTSQAGSEPASLNYNLDFGNPGQTFTMGSNSQEALSTLYVQEQISLASVDQPALPAYTLRIHSRTTRNSRALKGQVNCEENLPERVMEIRVKKCYCVDNKSEQTQQPN